jgi:mitogen-activated protein kinase kinase kinase
MESIGSNSAFPNSNQSSPRYAPSSRGYPSSRRFSRHQDLVFNPPTTAVPYNAPTQYRDESPVDSEHRSQSLRGLRQPRSPMERTIQQGLGSGPSSSSIARKPVGQSRLPHTRQSPSMEGPLMGSLPSMIQGIRVIGEKGQTKVVKVVNCVNSEDVVRTTLRKFGLREEMYKNYCFWVLDGYQPEPNNCRRISEGELSRICNDASRSERNRLILRKRSDGEPSRDELRRAAEIAAEEGSANHARAITKNNVRSQQKIQKQFGESWDIIQQQPLSPASYLSREHRDDMIVSPVSDRPSSGPAPRNPQLRSFLGQRPPSELISSNLTAYFPDHQKEEIERTVRMSISRSQRLSRASNRLSMASTLSSGSISTSGKDVPPVPSVGDAWLNGGIPSTRQPRPLSVVRFNSANAFRDSSSSYSLEPLSEESPIDTRSRKSYSSIETDMETPIDAPSTPISGTPTDNRISVTITDPQGKSASKQDFDDNTATSTPITENGDSFNAALGQALAEDGEDPDEELSEFITTDSWDNIKWMKGAMIGKGSFGSVFLALHSVTGELMAVKQVEMPTETEAQVDKKKMSMIDALKMEISLLKDMQHPNIVQYLGSSSDDEYLNIFLEYVAGGSVAAMLTQYGPLQEPLVRNFVRQILAGLSYLHGKEIIHRDIKGANVLVDNKGGIKISDFGISKRVETSSLLQKGAGNRVSLQGSVYWMAPEVVKQTSYTRKADIWSLGCLVVEMFTGTHPFPDCTQLQAIFKIGSSSCSPTIPDGISEEANGFLQSTFEVDHLQRPTADELLQSPFLKPIA